MTEHVQADTDDLADVTLRGFGYRSRLSGILEDLERRRTVVITELAHHPGTNWIDPFQTLLADATASDRFVQAIHDALVDGGIDVGLRRIGSGEAAAHLLMADGGSLFRVIETAGQGHGDAWDGKLSQADVAAVLANPEAFDDRAVAIAQFFRDSPEEWALFDTAREGLTLQGLAEGTMGRGAGDGITSFADVQQYVTNRQLFTILSGEVARADSVIRDLDANGRLDPQEFGAALAAIDDAHPNARGLTEAITFALDQDLLDEPDDRAWYRTVGDGLYTISSLLPASPTNLHRLVTEPGDLAADYWSFTRGAGSAVVGLGTFAYDLSAANPIGPGYWIESWRVGGDLSAHRGVRLGQTMPQVVDAGLSLVPGTPQHRSALAEVRRQGTWDAHPGLELARVVVDWEGFADDPAYWAGQLAPDVLIELLTGGGGVVTRLGPTVVQRMTKPS